MRGPLSITSTSHGTRCDTSRERPLVSCDPGGANASSEQHPMNPTVHENLVEAPMVVEAPWEPQDRESNSQPNLHQDEQSSSLEGPLRVRATFQAAFKWFWTEQERGILKELIEANRKPNGEPNWNVIYEHFPNKARSKDAVKRQYWNIMSQNSEPSSLTTGDTNPETTGTNPEIAVITTDDTEETTSETVVTIVTETPSVPNARWTQFLKHFQSAVTKVDRRPLNKPLNRPKREEISAIEGMVAKCMSDGPSDPKDSIRRLNAALYSAVKVMNEEDLQLGKRLFLEQLIEKRRELIKDISVLTKEVKRRDGPHFMGRAYFTKIGDTLTKYSISNTEEITSKLIYLKDKLKTIQKEIKTDNETRARKKARTAGTKALLRGTVEPTPAGITVSDIRKFWEGIIGRNDPVTIPQEFEDFHPREEAPQTTPIIDSRIWETVMKKTAPWKAPGPDGIHAGWWKLIPTASKLLKNFCQICLEDARHIPNWMCNGNVTLLYKGGEAINPSNYRPIACLNTCYKALTSTLTNFIMREVEKDLPTQQLAMKKGVRGCIEAHTFDQCIVKDAMTHKKPLCMMWIDMKKAYDSLNHGAIKWALSRWKVANPVINVIEALMSKNSLKYTLQRGKRRETSSPLRVTTGIMQGDSLSPLLFCLAIAPLSSWLEKTCEPYSSQGIGLQRVGGRSPKIEIGHLFYMDDLKIYAKSPSKLLSTYQDLDRLSKHLGLELNPNKCAMKFLNCTEIQNIDIPVLRDEEHYKYLGIEQDSSTAYTRVWDRILSECSKRIDILFESNLTIGQIITGYNQMIIPKIKFIGNCGIMAPGQLNTHLASARRIDTELTKKLWIHRIREQNSCTARLWCHRDRGGLGFRKAEYALEDSIIETWCYINFRESLELCHNMAKTLELRKKRSFTRDFTKTMEKYTLEVTKRGNQIVVEGNPYTTASKASRNIVARLNKIRHEADYNEWMKRPTSSRVITTTLENTTEDKIHPDSFLWLNKGMIGKKALRMILGAQEKTLYTRGSPRTLSAPGRCRMGCPYIETEEHIVSGCKAWRSTLMMERHDDICRYILELIYNKCGMEKPRKRITSASVENEHNVIHFNTPIHIVDQVRYNRPDIIWIQKTTAKAVVIEVSVPWFTRLETQEARKHNKYVVNGNYPEEADPRLVTNGHSLVKGLRRDRNLEVEFVPIIVGTQGECTSNLRSNLQKITGQENNSKTLEIIQRIAALGTNRILRNHLAKS